MTDSPNTLSIGQPGRSRILARAVDVDGPLCVYCGRPIEPAARYFTAAGEPRHMLCEPQR